MSYRPIIVLHRLCLVAIGIVVLAALLPAGTNQAQGQTLPTTNVRFDLTGNQVVDASDAWVVGDAWMDAREAGTCLFPAAPDRDVNSDGCVDVVDAQMVLAHWGEPVDPSQPLPDRDSFAIDAVVTFTVNSSGDQPDSNAGDGQCRTSTATCTLRAAIQESNVRPGPEMIHFDVRGTGGTCPTVVILQPATPLEVDDSDDSGVTIDGYSQCGASPNTETMAGNARIKIEIKGTGAAEGEGLVISSSNNVIRGLSLYYFENQIRLRGTATRNRIQGNFLGTNHDNTFAWSKVGSGDHGRGLIIFGGTYNVVGCGSYSATNAYVPCQSQAEFNAARNIVAGNRTDGIHIGGSGAYNRVVGNYVGLKQDGQTALPNDTDGIDINSGPHHNWIGGSLPGERNVISGNGNDGIEISHSSPTQYNYLVGNYWGLDATGTVAVPNLEHGITLEDGVSHTYVYDNVIASNGWSGLRIYIRTTYTEVYDNLIGVAADGQTAMPNGGGTSFEAQRNGILVLGGAQHNLIRTNVIANNVGDGVRLSNWSESTYGGDSEAAFNTISRNSMYNNGLLGIRLARNKIEETGQTTYPNKNLAAPSITGAMPALVSGRACAGCMVEVFIADKISLNDPSGDNAGEGKSFIGSGTANADGNFAAAVAGVEEGQLVTATATDGLGNTSPFAANVLVVQPPASPTPTVTPSPTRTPTLTPSATRTPMLTPSSTPTLTRSPTRTPTPSPSHTPSPTATQTWTPSATATSNPTLVPTVMPSPTAQPLATPTATLVPASTATPTPMATVAATVTPTVVRTPTATQSATSMPSPTPGVTVTPSPSLTTVATVSATPTHAFTPVVTATWTPTVAPTERAEPTQPPAASATPTTIAMATTRPTTTATPRVSPTRSTEGRHTLFLPLLQQ